MLFVVACLSAPLQQGAAAGLDHGATKDARATGEMISAHQFSEKVLASSAFRQVCQVILHSNLA